ncbi:MAG TPA: dihydrofolate reductase family protein [Holophagaceae bacterium]|nr:dihydrofolate reductase family protein [Holophagaceae bacterium]
MRIVVFTNLSLDGVMQAPGRPDEDLRDGFEHGGWAVPYAAMSQAGASMAGMAGLLLGRRTYEDFHAVWPQRKDSPFSAMLDNMQKYVASTTLEAPLPWMNSTLLPPDACDAVAELRAQPGGDLLIMGSGGLVQSLMRRDLIDLYVLMIHPLVLGPGRRLFSGDGPRAPLQLVSSKATANGVVIATYEREKAS